MTVCPTERTEIRIFGDLLTKKDAVLAGFIVAMIFVQPITLIINCFYENITEIPETL